MLDNITEGDSNSMGKNKSNFEYLLCLSVDLFLCTFSIFGNTRILKESLKILQNSLCTHLVAVEKLMY